MRLTTFVLYLFALTALRAQNPIPTTPAQSRLKGFTQREAMREASIANTIEFRSAGPTVMSGRVSDIEVWEEDPTHFYVAYASGGLWKTENNGLSFTPLFDKEAVMTIGDIAVDWETGTIWIGTGEVNASRSSYAGTGIYKSTDEGQTWTHLGLAETHHIGRILLHPSDPNTVWVAALGHLYSSNPERGLYKTTDGGLTWNRTLYAGPESGVVDLIMEPGDPEVLYAATWHRERRAWNFIESGAASAIYKSTDGGDTWARLTNPKSGFPTGEGAGRIGLDIVQADGKTILYAAIDNYGRRPKKTVEDQLTKAALRNMPKDTFLALPPYQIKDYLDRNGFPKKYDLKTITGMIEKEEIAPLALVTYVEDANSLLFDTPVIGLEVYRSENGGRTWKKRTKTTSIKSTTPMATTLVRSEPPRRILSRFSSWASPSCAPMMEVKPGSILCRTTYMLTTMPSGSIPTGRSTSYWVTTVASTFPTTTAHTGPNAIAPPLASSTP